MYQRHLHKPCRQLCTMQIWGHNTLSNMDKATIALSIHEFKDMGVDTQELVYLVGNKHYNKGIKVPTELTIAHPIRSNTSTTGTSAGYVAKTLRTTTQVVLAYAPRLGINIKQHRKIQ